MEITRCPWAQSPAMAIYHDEEWGVPSHDERHLFEMLTLEGAQAGLSWSTILARREGYRKAFANFDLEKVASYGDDKVEELLQDAGIIRNRAKVLSTISNAKAILRLRETTTLDETLWSFVGGAPIVNAWESLSEVPAKTKESDAMSKALKKLGFSFVGSTICYAFMQATGMVNDHLVSCFRY